MRFFKKNILTRISGLLILVTVFTTLLSQKKWEGDNKVIHGDVLGYYAYLPALFIHNDLAFNNLEEYDSHLGRLVWVTESEDGTVFIKFTSGMAMLYSPFFLSAHYLAEPLGYQANGFDPPYKVALVISSFFYCLVGLIFLSKFLLLHFKDSVVAIVLLTLYMGTNAFHYYTGDLTYSHGYSFALVAVFLFSASKWLNDPRVKWSILAGVAAGLFVLIRPVDILFLLFIPLAGVASFKNLKERFQLFWNNKGSLLVMVICFILMLLPQLLYYKYISGELLFYSYTDERFFFTDPHFYDILFSYRNGWLVYSPLMLLSLFGFLFLWKKKEGFGIFVLVTFFLYLYVIASWWCWWYVGFGNRAFVNIYPIFSIPLAYFIQYALDQQWFKKTAFKLIIFCGIALNIFQSNQYQNAAIHWGAMTEEAYWDSFGNLFPSQTFTTLLEFPLTEKAMQGADVTRGTVIDTLQASTQSYSTADESPAEYMPFFTPSEGYKGPGAMRSNEEYTLYQTIPVNDASVIQISAWIKCDGNVFLGSFRGDPFIVYNASENARKHDGEWRQLHLYSRIPQELELDSLEFYFWNQDVQELIVDDVQVSWCKESAEINEW